MGFLFRLYGQAESDSSQFERVSNMPLFSNKEISNFVQFYHVYLFNCVCKIDVWNEKKDQFLLFSSASDVTEAPSGGVL